MLLQSDEKTVQSRSQRAHKICSKVATLEKNGNSQLRQVTQQPDDQSGASGTNAKPALRRDAWINATYTLAIANRYLEEGLKDPNI